MKRLPVLFAALAMVGLHASCSVLEDRRPCPCFLDVDYTYILDGAFGADPSGFVRVEVLNPALEVSGETALAVCPDTAEFRVTRTAATVVGVVSPSDSLPWSADGKRIAYAAGNQMDSIYLHVSQVDCSGEEAYCLLTPTKQFSTVFITDNRGGEALRAYNLVVKGSTCGLDVRTGAALPGEYLYTVQDYDASGGISVRIPRQTGNDLVLLLYDRDTYTRRLTVPIGRRMIVPTGSGPLPDYEVQVDFEAMISYVRIADWDESGIVAIFK